MQQSLFFKKYFRTYLIPILLFIGSFAIYSYNLGDQPIKKREKFRRSLTESNNKLKKVFAKTHISYLRNQFKCNYLLYND